MIVWRQFPVALQAAGSQRRVLQFRAFFHGGSIVEFYIFIVLRDRVA